MTGAELAAYIRLKTKTDSTSFSNANIVTYANVEKDAIAREIEDIKKDYFTIPATTDLVAGQREYSIPVDTLSSLKLVEIKLDGTNWKRVNEFDLNSYKESGSNSPKPYGILDVPTGFSGATTDESSIQDNFSDENPLYEFTRNSIKIYTESDISAVTAGLKIHYTLYPANISESTLGSGNDLSLDPTTISFGIPRQFHKYWAMKVVIAYKEDNDIPLDRFDLGIADELKAAKKSMSKPNQDRAYQSYVPRRTGWKY